MFYISVISIHYLKHNVIKSVDKNRKKREKEKAVRNDVMWCSEEWSRGGVRGGRCMQCRFQILKQKEKKRRAGSHAVCIYVLLVNNENQRMFENQTYPCCACMEGRASRFTNCHSPSLSLSLSYGPTYTLTNSPLSSSLS